MWKRLTPIIQIAGSVMTALGTLGTLLSAPDVASQKWQLIAWFFLFVGTVIWRVLTDRQRIQELEDQATPKLEICFGGMERPYLQELLISIDEQLYVERRFRVGIRNIGQEVIHDARVVLERCQPTGDFVFPDLALGVMGANSPNDRFSVYPSDGPTVYVDVVFDRSPRDHGDQQGLHSDWIVIAYAQRSLPAIIPAPVGAITMTLRVDGGGLSARKAFLVQKSLADGRCLQMKEADDSRAHRLLGH